MLPGLLRHAELNQRITDLKKHWKSETNLLFLDFDGVFIIPRKNQNEYLERIAKLCQTYHLKAVITSTHRFDMNECENRLSPYKIPIIGRTELNGDDRNEQIYSYLSAHPFHHFVILDDMFLVKFQDYSVHCDFYTGFDESAYMNAVRILERQIQSESFIRHHK